MGERSGARVVWVRLPCPVLYGWWALSLRMGGVLGLRVMGASASGRMESQAPLPLLLSYLGYRFCCGQEAGVMHTSSPATTGFSEAMGSRATAGELKMQAPHLPFSQFCLLCVIQSTYL